MVVMFEARILDGLQWMMLPPAISMKLTAWASPFAAIRSRKAVSASCMRRMAR
jgi:hypothetical protein